MKIINQSETQVTFRVDIASQHMNRRYEQDNKNVWNPIYDKNQHLIGKFKIEKYLFIRKSNLSSSHSSRTAKSKWKNSFRYFADRRFYTSGNKKTVNCHF